MIGQTTCMQLLNLNSKMIKKMSTSTAKWEYLKFICPIFAPWIDPQKNEQKNPAQHRLTTELVSGFANI